VTAISGRGVKKNFSEKKRKKRKRKTSPEWSLLVQKTVGRWQGASFTSMPPGGTRGGGGGERNEEGGFGGGG